MFFCRKFIMYDFLSCKTCIRSGPYKYNQHFNCSNLKKKNNNCIATNRIISSTFNRPQCEIQMNLILCMPNKCTARTVCNTCAHCEVNSTQLLFYKCICHEMLICAPRLFRWFRFSAGD